MLVGYVVSLHDVECLRYPYLVTRIFTPGISCRCKITEINLFRIAKISFKVSPLIYRCFIRYAIYEQFIDNFGP